MSIPFTCSHCQQTFKARNDHAGEMVVCPACKKPTLVPKPGAPAATPPPVPATAAAAIPPTVTTAPAPPQPAPAAKPTPVPATATAMKPPAAPAAVPVQPTANGTPPVGKLAPRARPSAAAPKPPVPSPDAESLAAAALADEPPPVAAAPVVEPQTLPVTCSYCDHKFEVDRAKAGKNVPCPECRKIVKVPLPVAEKAKDWRTVGRDRPSLARTDTEPAPEGAWGTTTSAGVVSREALVEAEAILQPETEPTPLSRKLFRAGLAVALLAGVGTAVVFGLQYRRTQAQENVIQRVVDALEKKDKEGKEASGLPAPQRAALHRLAGGFFAKDEPRKALTQYAKSRSLLRDTTGPERNLQVIDLADGVADLFARQVELERRDQKWDELVQADLRRTLETLAGPDLRDYRAEALCRLTRKLADKPDLFRDRFLRVARGLSEEDRPEVLAAIGLELVSKSPDLAKELAGEAFAARQTSAEAAAKGGAALPAVPTLLALGIATDRPAAELNQLAPPPRDGVEPPPMTRLGYAEGWARSKQMDKARALARTAGRQPEPRLQALAAVAAAAGDAAGASDLEEAAELVKASAGARDQPVAPVVLWRLAQLSARAGRIDLAQRFAAEIADPELRGAAQLETFRARLAGPPGEADEAAVKEVGSPGSLASALAHAEWARHKARTSGTRNFVKVAEKWEPESLRPFGYAGVALGLQDFAR